jgi:hypothetical protein
MLMFLGTFACLTQGQILTPPTNGSQCFDGRGKVVNYPKFWDYATDRTVFENSHSESCERNSRGCKGVCMDAGTMYENGQCVYRSTLTADAQGGLTCMERTSAALQKRKPVWESLWRPADYQDHFQDIWLGYQRLKHIDPTKSPECAQLKQIYTSEVEKHAIKSLKTKPAGREGYHVQGKAMDLPNGSIPDRILIRGRPPTEMGPGEIIPSPPASTAPADYQWSSEESWRVEVQYKYFPPTDEETMMPGSDAHGPLMLCTAQLYQKLCSYAPPVDPACSDWMKKLELSWWNTDCSGISRDIVAEKCGLIRPMPEKDEIHYEPIGAR